MPNEQDLEAMYGASYRAESGLESNADSEESRWVLEWLDRLEPGLFVDYGCGSGALLVEAARRDWEVLGVELAAEVVDGAQKRTGLPVVTVDQVREKSAFADVLHLGDVLEHLTDLESEMPRILSLLKPGGILLAQGPLEANGNLFTWTLRVARALKGRAPVEMPPYHVVLATLEGQWALFQRFRLDAIERKVMEVSWPAPEGLTAADIARPRNFGLYSLRLVSKAVSRLAPGRWGNRYRYAGRAARVTP